ncbi:hypothetical protein D9619_009789 [Psilocybe cf. subviscida]|uniref:galacturonan 1,4-alpha-galacturonidase n=1 Tax=Psilocybe cf. subviscida TaxID=2480587 RepID=A0A8H5F6G2_9AGAR|nr:hypothetical protein D9619_009789 [Psilocybe cf. subviscida]
MDYIQYWLNANNTYRVVFIQNQASWFVVTGSDFEIDAHNTGGIQGNGQVSSPRPKYGYVQLNPCQAWWSYYATRTRLDGDGRPISLTLWKAVNGVVRNFRIESPPFWSNTVAQSNNIVYDGMFVNATNTDPLYKGKKSDNISLMNWDVTCGDDCLAIKGNSTNLDIRNIICRGGNGIAIGSLGQYVDMPDIVRNVHMQNLQVYLKTWDGTANGVPPTAGGGANGSVTNIVAENVSVDRVTVPIHLYQTNGGHSGDAPSSIKFQGLSFINWTGTAIANKIVDIECSPAVGCDNISFAKYSIAPPTNQTGSSLHRFGLNVQMSGEIKFRNNVGKLNVVKIRDRYDT